MGRITKMLPRIERAIKDMQKAAPGIRKSIQTARDAVSNRHTVLVRLETLSKAIAARKDKKLLKTKDFEEYKFCLARLKVLDQNVSTCIAAMNLEYSKSIEILHRFEANEIDNLIADKEKKAKRKGGSKNLAALFKAYSKLSNEMKRVGEDHYALTRFMQNSATWDIRPEVPPRILNTNNPQQLAAVLVDEGESPYDY